MQEQNFTTSFLVEQSPEEVFNAVNNVRDWWSEEINGTTDRLNAEFDYHYQDVHRCKMKITEFVPGKKVTWLVMDNYFNFTKDQSEWKDTKIEFEISRQGDKTQLVFTHAGLVPAYECYNICADAWGNYVNGSLRSLIETGKGKPNPYETAVKSAADLKSDHNKNNNKEKQMDTQNYSASFLADQSPKEVFDAVNNISGWWTENVEGHSEKLNDEFEVQFGDVHYSKQKLVEVIPGKKVVWLITDSKLNFIKNKSEWTGTQVSFEISQQDGKTKLLFTHIGLVPAIECYSDCSNAWGDYINNSLKSFVTTGKGKPTKK